MDVRDETLGSLQAHWHQLVHELVPALPRAKRLALRPNSVARQTVAVLACANGQVVERNQGRAAVIPLLWGSGDKPRYWVGYIEEWEDVGGRKPYRFKSANLTFFLESLVTGPAVQLFRAEWPGVREWTPGEPGWQSPGAGHPHWQFDALEHYASSRRRAERRERLAQLLEQGPGQVETFGPDVLAADELVSQEEEAADDTSWTAMHFASGARWPMEPWSGDRKKPGSHTWAPANLGQIRAWATSAVIYTREELLKATKGCQV